MALADDTARIIEEALEPAVDNTPTFEAGEGGGLTLGAPGLPQLTSDEFLGIMGTSASNWFSQLLNDDGSDSDMPFGDGAATGARDTVLDLAYGALGVPYKWGWANLSRGVDCSGLIQQIFQRIGVNLPRISADQARSGLRVPLNELRPGDLVAWDNSSRNHGADHIAIYIGNGRVIHAPNPGETVTVDVIWDTDRAWGVRVLED